MDDLYVDVFDVQLGSRELDALEALRTGLDRTGQSDEVAIAAEVNTVTEFEAKAAFLLWSGLRILDAKGEAGKAMARFQATVGDRDGGEDRVVTAHEIALVLWLRRAEFSQSVRDALIRWLNTLGLDAEIHRRIVDLYLTSTS